MVDSLADLLQNTDLFTYAAPYDDWYGRIPGSYNDQIPGFQDQFGPDIAWHQDNSGNWYALDTTSAQTPYAPSGNYGSDPFSQIAQDATMWYRGADQDWWAGTPTQDAASGFDYRPRGSSGEYWASTPGISTVPGGPGVYTPPPVQPPPVVPPTQPPTQPPVVPPVDTGTDDEFSNEFGAEYWGDIDWSDPNALAAITGGSAGFGGGGGGGGYTGQGAPPPPAFAAGTTTGEQIQQAIHGAFRPINQYRRDVDYSPDFNVQAQQLAGNQSPGMWKFLESQKNWGPGGRDTGQTLLNPYHGGLLGHTVKP